MAVIDLSYLQRVGGGGGWEVGGCCQNTELVSIGLWMQSSAASIESSPLFSFSSNAESRDCLICDTPGNWGHAASRVC